ncbi:hypothetical protein Y032_0019g3800 [Ancylostoma ceylanicum]|uniref:beta-mannosidase n=1 Tax=Ancylostoma ceylanicum TaxID=53326 RepID=A0A016V1R3_9BILA|nr:hypothetical protein Y032_0019g3800 [Ancylostoma ceylanicum]
MSAVIIFLLSFILVSSASSAQFETADLQGQWKFYNSNKTVNGRGIVPGDIFSDLHRLGFISDPLFADNHLHLRWVSSENWTYSKTFEVDKRVLEFNTLLLRLKGIDTVSTVFLNGVSLLKTNNQFVEYVADVAGILGDRNVIEFQFMSPVLYAEKKSKDYLKSHGHLVPPVCPPAIYHGECHPNFIRKAQYSFAWDWGPSFPTIGISKPLDIVAFDGYFIHDFSWIFERTSESWSIHGDVRVFVDYSAINVTIRVAIEELDVDKEFVYNISAGAEPAVLNFKIAIPTGKVELWWPNGQGQQKLYTIKLVAGEQEISRRVGFRHIELVQDLVDEKHKDKGRHFYFKLNDRPIFLKGSNWIPISMFPSANHTRRLQFLLDSAVEAGMNTLRVWGGGVYESEEFYDYADEKGILLWQDLMFACALYPIDDDFLDSVRTEVQQQVWRIKHHASVLVWAGNNENEIAIRSHWWSVANYTEDKQVEDYTVLYSGTIKSLVEAADPSRPFLLSSPSNGVRTEELD